jgi:hypothetical protein
MTEEKQNEEVVGDDATPSTPAKNASNKDNDPDETKGFWNWVKKHIGSILFAFLMIAVIAAVIVLAIYNRDAYDYFFTESKEHSHFQWIGISTLVAVVGFLFNQLWERRKFNADIKSKSRIDWMKTVRNVLARYTVLARDVQLQANTYLNYRKFFLDDKEGRAIALDSLNKKSEEFTEQYSLLLLYISKKPDNQELNDKITALYKFVDAYRILLGPTGKFDPGTLDDYKGFIKQKKDETNRLIDDLTDYARDYMSNEWERAKRGE